MAAIVWEMSPGECLGWCLRLDLGYNAVPLLLVGPDPRSFFSFLFLWSSSYQHTSHTGGSGDLFLGLRPNLLKGDNVFMRNVMACLVSSPSASRLMQIYISVGV